MNGHLDIKTLSGYFLNMLPPEEETAVQEHLSHCNECSARLEAMRKLRRSMFREETEKPKPNVFFRILHSGWTKAAAAVIIAGGIGAITVHTVRSRSNILVQHEILNSGNEGENALDIDTFDMEDSLYYREKYGEDFDF